MISPVLVIFFYCASSFAQMPDVASLMANKADPSLVPASYHFSYKYAMEIEAEGKKTNVDYLIEKDAPYFAAHINQLGNDMMMIMDTKAKLNIATVGMGTQKMAIVSKAPDVATGKNGKGQFTFRSLPDKTILGYKCKGVEATNSEHVVVFYYTNDAPVSFEELFKSSLTVKMPEAFSGYFKSADKPLIMLMESTDKASGKKGTMKCISLGKEAYTFNKSDYKFM